MNNEPVKFLPQNSMAQTYLKGFTPAPTANTYRSDYSHAEAIVNRIDDNTDREYMAFFVARNREMGQQIWDLKMELDQMKYSEKAWMRLAVAFLVVISVLLWITYRS